MSRMAVIFDPGVEGLAAMAAAGAAGARDKGACFCASPSEEALGRCGALGEGAVRAGSAARPCGHGADHLFHDHRQRL